MVIAAQERIPAKAMQVNVYGGVVHNERTT